MDHEILVDIQIEEGRPFIAELVRAGIDVAVAFWIKTDEESPRVLYIGSNALGSMPTGDVFVAIYDAWSRSRPTSFTYEDIKHALPSNPVAVEVMRIRDRYRANLPTRLRTKKLGEMPVEEVYIYPRSAGPMNRDDVVQTVAALMSRPGAFAPSSIILSDGSLLHAVPTSLQLGMLGELRIVLHDPQGNTDRTVSADEVINIH